MAMTWGYIAGFFDGESTVAVATHSTGRKSGAYIAQSGPRGLIVLTEIQEFLETQGIKSSVFQTGVASQHKRTMPSYRLAVNGFVGVTNFLSQMLPYLRVKRTVAQDILRYNKMYPNIQRSPLAAAWRREIQQKAARGRTRLPSGMFASTGR